MLAFAGIFPTAEAVRPTFHNDPQRVKKERKLIDGIREVTLTEHPLLPAFHIRHSVGKQLQRVVRRQHRNTQHISQRDEHKEMFHIHARAQRGCHLAVRRHTIEYPFKDAAPSPFFGRVDLWNFIFPYVILTMAHFIFWHSNPLLEKRWLAVHHQPPTSDWFPCCLCHSG